MSRGRKYPAFGEHRPCRPLCVGGRLLVCMLCSVAAEHRRAVGLMFAARESAHNARRTNLRPRQPARVWGMLALYSGGDSQSLNFGKQFRNAFWVSSFRFIRYTYLYVQNKKSFVLRPRTSRASMRYLILRTNRDIFWKGFWKVTVITPANNASECTRCFIKIIFLFECELPKSG